VSCVRDNHHNRDPRYPETTRPRGVVAPLGMHSSVKSNSKEYIYIYIYIYISVKYQILECTSIHTQIS
jgi:hypothetical protein